MKSRDFEFENFLRAYRIESFQHESYPDVTEAIRTGDVEKIESIDWRRYCRDGIGRMSDDPIMQARFLLISAGSMASMIAIEMGVDGEVMMSLVDYYAQLSQRTSKVNEIYDLVKESMVHFCRIIRSFLELPQSKTVRQVTSYVEKNITAPIHIGVMAAELQINPSYLSKRFREECGMSIKDYIYRRKMREAKNLMQYTDLSLTDVAVSLGFTDLSHFSRICRQMEDCTPKQLKKKLIMLVRRAEEE